MEDKPPPLLVLKKTRRYTQIAYYDKAISVFLCMDDIIKTVDLGHDDCDGQECKDGRSRTWMVLLYEDDPTHKQVLEERLSDLDWNYAGRQHDKDDGVKEHHHVVVLFKDGRKNTDIALDLGIDKRWLRAWDRKKKALRYLCHRDNPEKFQYSTDGMYGTIAEQAVAACSKGNELSEVQSVLEITKQLDEIEGFVSYSFFLNIMAQNGLYATFRRMGNLASKLIDEHNAAYRKRIDDEVHRDNEREKFKAFLRSIDELPFDERCDILERKGFPPLSMD